jgi:hypothetical protein
VRNKLLAVFRTDKTVKEVCSILRGGRARNLHFVFDGYADDFSDLSSMIITADVSNAPVMIPEIDLFLSTASGQIRIEDGVLYGYDMEAGLKKSTATDGNITIGISGPKEDLLKLDMNMTADLKELKTTLNRLVKDRTFQEELAKISNISGTASGHLYLGDSFDDFDIYVDVEQMDGEGFYSRIALPLKIDGGSLKIRPGYISWAGVRGKAGRSTVTDTTGRIGWSKNIDIDIKEIKADLDLGQVMHVLDRYALFHTSMEPVLADINGTAGIEHFRLSGTAGMPGSFRLSSILRPGELYITTPLFPHNLAISNGSIKMSEDRLELDRIKIHTDDGPAMISASLRHEWFQNYRGNIRLSASIGHTLSSWLASKEWIPPYMMPAIPLKARQLDIEFSRDSISLAGNLSSAQDDVNVNFDILNDTSQLAIRKLNIINKTHSASLYLDQHKTVPRSTYIEYSGNATTDMFDRLLADNRFIKGHLAGNCTIDALYGENIRLYGSIDAAYLHIPVGDNSTLTVAHATAAANGTTIDIKQLSLINNGEEISIRGNGKTEGNGIHLDLDATAGQLHYTYNRDMSFDMGFRDAKASGTSMSEKSATMAQPYGLNIYGAIRFHIKKFIYNRPISVIDISTDANVTSYILTDIRGSGEIDKNGTRKGEISEASLCGCMVKASWTETADNSTLIIKAGTEEEIMFDNLVPCLNMPEKFIEGPLKLNMEVVRSNGHWNNGWLNIHSHDGRLPKMTLISKIFNVINIVDLLSPSGWKDLTERGLSFKKLDYESTIKDDAINITRFVINGVGINLFGAGSIYLDPPTYDMVVGISPLKTMDMILTNVPIFGKALGGKEDSFIVIPVAVKGAIDNPEIKTLPGSTFTGVMKRIFNTITTPVTIFIPEKTKDKDEQSNE